jgi:geranylgeranyl reductase
MKTLMNIINTLEEGIIMQKYEKEIAIIGAGPAGLACAKILAEQGKKVTIFDKLRYDDIGKKICTEALSSKSLSLLYDLYSNLPDNVFELKPNTFDVYININGKERKTYSDIGVAMVSRKKLQKFMLKEAMDSGANIFAHSELKSLDTKNSILNFKDRATPVLYSKLVAADGSNSIIRKGLELKSSGILCSSFKIPYKEKKLICFLDIKKYGLNIPFIFPHGEFAFAGLWNYSQYPVSFNDANILFNEYCKDRFGYEYLDKKGGYGLINSNYKGYKFGDIYLSGDSGGFSEAFYGEGIYWALKSGELVGKELSGLNVEKEWEEFLKQKRKHDNLIKSFFYIYKKLPEFIKKQICSVIDFGASHYLSKSTGGRRAKKMFDKYVSN